MKIQYLGTAAAEGWPGLFCTCEACERAKALGGKNIRTRSQVLLDGELLMDFPPDSYLHMVRDGLDLPSIRHILITHTHQDHLYLEDLALRCEWFANDLEGVLTLYGNDKLARKFEAYMGTEAYHELTRKWLACKEVVPYIPLQIGTHTVTPMLARHDKNERCYIYLIERDGKAMLYGNDTGVFPEETWGYLDGRHLDLVSLDCTVLRHAEGTNHMGIPDVLKVQTRLREMGCADASTTFLITHFSHNGELMHDEIEAEVGPHGFVVAFDGMEIEI